ncbi:16S rRNA m(2)G-966 methyltransferase [Onishia taeanensis]|uniref:Ribosomal RNA small subunit methyltransferase D n=1 Tax=Onishia taeanensis TaxID=284577 RepID=A0A1G7NYB6_9GAMM|nr:16S rRNA (guanine(966)-N(2))-methyltransferase RsmD [Halomonas taeanensis]SDF78994.1 16S rRNA m(2)G-966 methyltransferase [Halomonas taeanensis]
MKQRRSSSSRSRRQGKAQGNGSNAGRRDAGRLSAGRLRIIGGDFRRRQLPVLDHPGLRPTPDRVRETLFNWLASATGGARVLDLFAGTGALGLEALSRGAREALFIEQNAPVARALEANIATLGANGRVITADAKAFLGDTLDDRLGRADGAFDLVFLDPPFRQGLAEASCRQLVDGGFVAAGAWVYLEVEAELTPSVPADWMLHREVRAGDSCGRLYRLL